MTTYIYTFKVHLTPLQDIVLTNFTGTIALSMFLKMLDRVEPGLSDKFHSAKGMKPYSVTPFFLREQPVTGVKPVIVRAGSSIWFRVSIIGDLGYKLLPVLTELMGSELELFQIRAKAVISNIEVQVRSAETLLTDGSTVFRIRYLTPTRFAIRKPRRTSRARYSFCPEAWRLVKSALRHWREFVDIHISDKIILWTYQNVIMMDFGPPSNFKSNVITVKLPRGGIVRGYVGFALYKCLGRRKLREFWALLRYSELMNVGTGKSMGLGVIQIEELPPKGKTTAGSNIS